MQPLLQILVANLIKVDTGSANLGAIHVEKNVSGSFFMQECFLKIGRSLSDWRDFMGNRARDRVIYIRTNEKLQAEFEKQKEVSGYGSNADFVDYLLRINEGKQIDGVTLKDVRNLLSELSAELKKQGVNINQIAKILNTYGGMDMKQSLEYTEYRYKQIENSLLRIWEKIA